MESNEWSALRSARVIFLMIICLCATLIPEARGTSSLLLGTAIVSESFNWDDTSPIYPGQKVSLAFGPHELTTVLSGESLLVDDEQRRHLYCLLPLEDSSAKYDDCEGSFVEDADGCGSKEVDAANARVQAAAAKLGRSLGSRCFREEAPDMSIELCFTSHFSHRVGNSSHFFMIKANSDADKPRNSFYYSYDHGALAVEFTSGDLCLQDPTEVCSAQVIMRCETRRHRGAKAVPVAGGNSLAWEVHSSGCHSDVVLFLPEVCDFEAWNDLRQTRFAICRAVD